MADRRIAAGSGDLARLRRRLSGQVLLPNEDGYHQARRVWNAMVDRRPAVIARCASPADVAAAVGFARTRDLEIGVRCGGHSVLGVLGARGGLMVDLTPLGAVRVDPDRRRAWVQGGALLGAPSAGGAVTLARAARRGAAAGDADRLGRRRRCVPVAAAGGPEPADGQRRVRVGGRSRPGAGLLAALRNGASPLVERVQELSYLELQQMDDAGHRHGVRRYWKGHFLRELDDAAVDTFLARGDGGGDPALLPFAGLQSYGGAVEPFASGVYVNALGDEGEEGVQRAYGPDKLARLAALKDRYDPENVFHLNHNIRPRKEQPQ